MRKFKKGIVVALLIFLFTSNCYAQQLTASWYSRASLVKEGTWKNGERRMANGEKFSDNRFTCATRLYALGSKLLVTNIHNGCSVEVIVTDRIGKRFAKTRIDLSKIAFGKIALHKQGLVQVDVKEIK